MRAAVYDPYGPPAVLRVEEVPTPTPGPNQGLVRVLATSVNLFDSSRWVQPMRKFHFCQGRWPPAIVKLGPWGWVISSGLTSALAGSQEQH